jgi:hypothetical protein
MKKFLLVLIILILAGITAWKLIFKKEDAPAEQKEKPLVITNNSNVFTVSFSKLLEDYYGLKDALVDWDSAKANDAAKALKRTTDSLPVNILKGDSAVILTAQNLQSSMSNELKGFIGETTLEQKRRAFNALTDEMYNMVRTVRYDGGLVYHMRCPMAFNETEEAFWLSKNNKIVNPYLGNKHPKYHDKMLGCGELVDSLDFEKK